MSFHPELLVNHLVKEFLPEKPKMVKLHFKTRTGTRRNYMVESRETRIVDIIDNYDEYEPLGYYVEWTASKELKMITDHLFRHAQITLRGLKILGAMVKNNINWLERHDYGVKKDAFYRLEKHGQKKVRIDYIDVEARVFNKIEWWEDKSLLEHTQKEIKEDFWIVYKKIEN